METFYLVVINIVKGSLVSMLAAIILSVSGYYTVKTIRIFIALLKYAITEPENKIVKKVQREVKKK